MCVYVGNEQAKDFKAMSEPFGGDNSLWNSLAVIDTGTVVAVGGMDGHIDMIKGRAVRQLEVPSVLECSRVWVRWCGDYRGVL